MRVVLVVAIFLTVCLGIFGNTIAPPALFVYGNLNYNNSYSNVIDSNLPTQLQSAVLLNYNDAFSEWSFHNVSLTSFQTFSGSLVLGDTEVYTFGMNAFNGRGINDTAFSKPVRARDFSPERVVSLISIDTVTTVLLTNGSAYSWGSGNRATYGLGKDYVLLLGQEGSPSSSVTIEPLAEHPEFEVLYPTSTWLTFALDREGNLYSWGARRQTGGTATPYDHLVPTISINASLYDYGQNHIIQVDGASHLMALLDNGTFLCWGDVTANACGDNTNENYLTIRTPFAVDNRPPGLNWSKIAIARYLTYAIANDSSLWAWGAYNVSNVFTPMVNALTNPACNGISPNNKIYFCQVHQVTMPPGRENAKVLDIMNGYDYMAILNEYNEIWWIGADWSGSPQNWTWTWKLIDIDLPNGHAFDFSRTQTSGQTVFFMTKPIVSCPEPKPIIGNDQATCSQGIWTVLDDAVIAGDISLSGPVEFRKNLTIVGPVIISIDASQNSGQPYLNVAGCIKQIGNLTVDINLDKGDLNKDKIDPIILAETNSACPSEELLTKVTQPKNCRKAKLAFGASLQPSERVHLIGFVSVNKSGCNTWWIILVSVLGGAFLITGIIIYILIKCPSVKYKCRPYAAGYH